MMQQALKRTATSTGTHNVASIHGAKIDSITIVEWRYVPLGAKTWMQTGSSSDVVKSLKLRMLSSILKWKYPNVEHNH